MLPARLRVRPYGRGNEVPVGGEGAEADANRGVTRSRLAADLWLVNGLDRNAIWGNTCVATNLTIRRINRRDSAVSQVVGGAAPDVPLHRGLAHYFTWLNGYQNSNVPNE